MMTRPKARRRCLVLAFPGLPTLADIPGPASPDGGRLVFFAARAVEGQAEADKPPYGLYVVGLDGTALVCLEPDLRAGQQGWPP